MKILLTGANGYIGKRLLPVLVKNGHFVYACVRDKNTLSISESQQSQVKILELDFLDKDVYKKVPEDVDISYYLMHALGSSPDSFSEKEIQIAKNFNKAIGKTKAQQVIYLGGISNDDNLSEHLKSRENTEALLKESGVPLTVFRAAIIIGSGGASFEIIRDLVEKLPFMIAPKWLNTRCQPIAIRNVIDYLSLSIAKKECYNQTFDIGGPDILTYKEMLLRFAAARNMKRTIITVPVMTPRLSSYWLFFVTSTAYRIAVNLVNSMKNEVIVKRKGIENIIAIDLISYDEAVRLAFKRIEQNMVLSSWIDSEQPKNSDKSLNHFIQVPGHGVFKDQKSRFFPKSKKDKVIANIWSIGGDRGWYYGNWLWRIRGYIDKLFGGVGLRRGRRSPTDIYPGDSLDFWKVLLASKEECRLLLYAEMKLPGEAWLEFKVLEQDSENLKLVQTATFRPRGLAGRLYWYLMLPFHAFIFKNMAKNITLYSS